LPPMTYQGVSNVHHHSHASIPGIWVIWSVLQMQSLRNTAFKLMENRELEDSAEFNIVR